MQGRTLFEYAVVRVVPRVEREEFVNVGIVLYCAANRFLQFRYSIPQARIQCFCATTDLAEVDQLLQGFNRICQGMAGSGTIGTLPPAGRFRWLTAKRSTIVQSSAVHPGLCIDPQTALNNLFDQLVA